MTRNFLHYLIYLSLLVGLIISSCNGQENTRSSNETTNATKPSPEIIGTPPTLLSHPGTKDTTLVSQYIRCIFQDSKGNFWFGPAGQSVVRYDIKTLKYFSKNEFFHGNKNVTNDYGNSVHAIAEDKNGNIWFGTDHGVIKYNHSAYFDSAQHKSLRTSGQIFRSYTEENGLSNIHVNRKSILVDKSGNMWVGTAAGVFRYNPSADSTGGKCFSLFNLLPPVNVKDIMEDKDGNIWFATQDNGVFRYDTRLSDEQGNEIKNITMKEGLGDNYAGGMVQDKAGNIWFTMKNGICRYDPSADLSAGGQTFKEFTTKDGIGGSEVWGIFMERSGIIWITARGSTTRFDPSIPVSDPKAFTVFTEADGINCCVQSMYQDREGNMWWGAGAGLYRFDGKRFYQVKQDGPW